jgi:hypothetical protein
MATIPVLPLVLAIQLILSLISTIGAQTINNMAWQLFLLLPTEHSTAATKTSSLRKEVVRLQREMLAVSAQDNFAKWARLRREHDRAKDLYEKNGTLISPSIYVEGNGILTSRQFHKLVVSAAHSTVSSINSAGSALKV